MSFELLIASHNPDKLKELEALLAALPLNLHSLQEFPHLEPTEEDQDTIAKNAMKKALEAAQGSGMLCLADDTGLFIEALDNAPGVYAARFAGENCSYADNRHKVLKLMEKATNRQASFRTAAALASPQGILAVVEGRMDGEIIHAERGSNGFGYDSIFAVTGISYAEMDESAKNQFSHRAEALKAMLPILASLINRHTG